MSAKLGFVELLERAAEVLDAEAAALKEAESRNGRWWGDYATAKEAHDEMRGLAKQLRKSAAYHKPNPLGGPARVFDACADSIRAGDSITRAMAEYGLKWAKR